MTTATEKRVRTEIRTSDAMEVVNAVLSYEQSREMAREALENHEARTGYGTTAEGSLAHYLKEWMEEQRPEKVTGASVWTDLLSAAFGAVGLVRDRL